MAKVKSRKFFGTNYQLAKLIRTYRLEYVTVMFLLLISGMGLERVRGRILGFRDIMAIDPEVRLVAVGDVMLGRSVNAGMARRESWVWPFEKVAERLAQADVTLGNLEAPFGDKCPPTVEGMIFCADTRSIEGLVAAGFDAVSLENNHVLNQGVSGKKTSQEWLEKHGIQGVVSGEVEVLRQQGLLVGLVAFDDVSRRVTDEEVVRMVNLAEQKADIVVVNFHWGWEYQGVPNARQQELGRTAVDAGAKLVLGHHPHWVQTVEEYRGGVIVYSLGNFVFDQMWSEETRKGWVGEFVLSKEGVKEYRMMPVKIYDYGQPRWEEGAE